MEIESESASRPKGFFRRNWLSLLLLLGCLQVSVTTFSIELNKTWLLKAWKGDLALVGIDLNLLDMSINIHQFTVDFTSPHFGTMPKSHTIDVYTSYQMPILIPMISILVWIAFREGQRKRIKSKEQHGI